MASNSQIDVASLFSNNCIFSLLAVALAICCYAWFIKRPSMVPPLPPGPRGLPLLGNLPFLEPDLHTYLAKLSETYGPIMKLQLGRKVCIVITSPLLARQALKDHGAIFSNRDPLRAGLAGTYGGLDIAWSIDTGPEWRNLRKVFVREMMSNESLQACYEFRRREVRAMVKEIRGKVGSSVDIGKEMSITLLNVLSSMLLGSSLGNKKDSIRAESKHVVEEFVDLLGKPNVSDFFPIIARFDLQGIESKIKKVSLWFDRIFEAAIASKSNVDQANADNKNKDFLQLLLESSLTVEQIKAVLMDIFIAGTDTTSVTIEWAMTQLLRNPKKMMRAQEEIDSVVGCQNILEDSHLGKLVYLDAVIKEVLRLHPPVPLLIPHSPSISYSLAGYNIPKGCRILFNVWQMQRDPKVWANPLDFEPERFLKSAGNFDYQGNNFNYWPFGSGRRICAGIPLAERMTMYVLATLLHSFDWKLLDDMEVDVREKFGIVLRKEKPLVAIPTTRLHSTEQYS